MTAYESHRNAFVEVLDSMLTHPQRHHGWAGFYEALRAVLHTPSAAVPRPLRQCWRERPELSMPHIATLLGMAVRHAVTAEGRAAHVFNERLTIHERAAHLGELLDACAPRIEQVLLDRHNSFTGARRFLLPQLLIGSYAVGRMPAVRFLDLGTGLGVLPRQLNQRHIFQRFWPDLRWPGCGLTYRPIPLECRHAIDRAPLPDLDWVRMCHGPSPYYEQRLSELMWSLRQPSAGPPVLVRALDLLDSRALAAALAEGGYNAITCNFVLYQYSEAARRTIVETVLAGLARPGLFISMELDPAMSRPGCRVVVYLADEPAPLHVADVSDAHFMGTVTNGPGFGAFRRHLHQLRDRR